MRRSADIKKTLRGRPKLGIQLDRILCAVRRHGQVVAAARELRCSPAYIHKRLNEAGVTLGDVLTTQGPEDRTS